MENSFSALIKSYVSNGSTSDALSTLLEASKSNKDVHDTIIMIVSDFNDLTNQKIRGTISSEEATLRFNKINDRILAVLSFFTKEGKVLPKITPIMTGKNNSSINAVKVLTILTLLFGIICFILSQIKDNHLANNIAFFAGTLSFATFIALLIALVLSSIKFNNNK